MVKLLVESKTVCNLEDLSNKLRSAVKVDSDGIPQISQQALDILDKIKECIISEVVGEEVDEAIKWVETVKRVVERLRQRFRLAGFTYPREFASFIEDPIQHLKKKLFNYIYDLARGKISLDEFRRRAAAAVRTSLRTNMRTAYQIWGLTSIAAILAERGYELVYPEHRFLNFDRSGKQKLGIIPPNFVLLNLGKGYLSFFHEAPRPLGWEDTHDLQRIWSLYTALRPDAMVYGGKVLNIVDLGSSPPIRKPNIILEFKELSDWYTRTRDLRGHFRKPLTAEEWRSKWLEGLFEGLADIMGVKRSEVRKRIEEGVTLRIKEYQLVQLYKSTYKPDVMILVSRTAVPADVKRYLESIGILVVDDVQFDAKKLEPVADVIERYASYGEEDRISIALSIDVARMLAEVMKKLGVNDVNEVLRLALKRLLSG